MFDAYVNSFKDGIACVTTDEHIGFIDKLGNWLFDTTNEKITHFSEGLAVIAAQVKEPQNEEDVRSSLKVLSQHWVQLQEVLEHACIEDQQKIESLVDQFQRYLDAFREELCYWIDVPARSLSYEQLIADLAIEEMLRPLDDYLLEMVKNEIEDGLRGVRGKQMIHAVYSFERPEEQVPSK